MRQRGASTTGTVDEQDQATWRVDDVASKVAQLRSRGVEILEFDLPGIKTVDGIADVGHAFAAWFLDPGKNSLQFFSTSDLPMERFRFDSCRP